MSKMGELENICGELLAKERKEIDLKQWLPLAGLYFIFRDGLQGKPTLDDYHSNDFLTYFSSLVYHATITGQSVYFVLEKLGVLL